jgi:predicted ABC-type transport system involved in lysophospholipase L1 biosynthesis ATPase subunit
MTNSTPLLRLVAVAKAYPSVTGEKAVGALESIDLTVRAGESVAILGQSGSGKSTLLNIIGGLDQPSAGEVWLDGEDMAKLDEKQLATVRNRKIGFIFQAHHLLPYCTALENALVPTLVLTDKAMAEAAPERARKLLARVGLGDRLEHRPGQLSGGEQQRVAVVRSLMNHPKLLLGDEPTGALDRRSSDSLASLLVELNREEGVALVLVTHSPNLAARVGRRFELSDGRLREQA